jgi:hypothetical protein
MMSNILTVPAEMVGHLRNGLHSAIQPPVEGIAGVVDRAGRERHPEWYLEHFARLDQVLALLDVIGWSETDEPTEVRIDLCEHREALLKAIEVLAFVAHDDLDELDILDAERAKRGELPTRSATLKRATAVSDFGWTAIVSIARLDAAEQTSP